MGCNAVFIMTEALKAQSQRNEHSKLMLTPLIHEDVPVPATDLSPQVTLFALRVLDWHLSELGWDRSDPSEDYVWHQDESAEEISPSVSSVVLRQPIVLKD
jgi:hypothetical protein